MCTFTAIDLAAPPQKFDGTAGILNEQKMEGTQNAFQTSCLR
jgi:hypothetical protein